MSRALKLAQRAKAMFEAADLQHRELTGEERVEVERLLDEAKALGPLERQIDDIGRAIGAPQLGNWAGSLFAPTVDPAPADPGSVFVNSDGFKAVKDSGSRPENWSTGLIEVQPYQTKGTLGESGTGNTIGGGAFVSVPQVVPGVVTTLFQPLTIESLLSSNVATTNTVRFITEGTATSAAAGVAEGGTKPESTLGLVTTDEPIKKIANVLPASDEILEDVPAVQAYINGRLSLFVQNEAERQIFRGAGTNELVGLFGRSVPVYNYISGTVDNKAIQLFKALNSMRGSALIEPEWIVMHPNDYQTLRLLADTSGQLLGGGPFMGAYGSTQVASQSNQITGGATDQVWNKPCYVTANVGGPGTALIGTTANGCVYNRGGLSVEATNSHASFFVTNEVMIRAERRLGLATYRTKGFLEVRFGTAASIA